MALIQPTFLLCCPVPLGVSLITLVTLNCLGLCGKISFSIIDSAIPKIRWKSRKIKHWFSSSTTNLIHKKCKLYQLMCWRPKSTNKSQYHTISNLAHSMTRYETKKRSTNLSQSPSTVKKFWSWINSVRRHCKCLPPLRLDNSTVTGAHAKADMFNKCDCLSKNPTCSHSN